MVRYNFTTLHPTTVKSVERLISDNNHHRRSTVRSSRPTDGPAMSTHSSESHDGDNDLPRRFPDWPSEPVRLGAWDVSSVLSIVGDVVMLLLALAFAGACILVASALLPLLCLRNFVRYQAHADVLIGLAIAAWSLHGKPIKKYPMGEHVEKACKLVSWNGTTASPDLSSNEQLIHMWRTGPDNLSTFICRSCRPES
jgi:hypothetical protein